MCGIVVAFSPREPTTLASVVAMTHALRHRGPDDEGYLVFDGQRIWRLAGEDTPVEVLQAATASQPQGAAQHHANLTGTLLMGHRRLAIVDVSPLGHQPMRRGDLHAVFNGEIYNHWELRAELEALGHQFNSRSDTEVLLAAYEQWGAQCLARFNGMWAIAIHDAKRGKLLIARDRFGVKPLYWWQGAGGEMVCASEIKSLLRHPRIQARENMARCVAFARSGPQAWSAETEFLGIERFPVGQWCEIDLEAPNKAVPQVFWKLPEPAGDDEPFDRKRAESLSARYLELLDDAVRLRMRVDVRFGTALSGGLDSSSIALLVNGELQRRGAGQRAEQQEVFSSIYRSSGMGDSDESDFIARVGARLGVRSNVVEPRANDVVSAHERMIWALDTPPMNTLMSSWHTFGLVARRGVVVTLDGQGADEQLAGYSRYVRNHLVHADTATGIAEARAIAGRLQGFGAVVAAGLAGHAVRRVGGRRVLAALARGLRVGGDPAPTVGEAMRADFATHLQNLLLYADKTSMAWSVESRMPFMDVRLVEFLAGVPSSYKIHDGWTKWLARHGMADRLPGEVVWRTDKMGWAIPERQWFDGGPLESWLASRIAESAFVREVLRMARIGASRAALSGRLRLLNLAVWHEQFFEQPGRPGRALGRDMPFVQAEVSP